MQTPDFWFKPRSWQASLLAPLGALYAWGTARRLTRGEPQAAPVPVICIGNINAGGTGKTPSTICIAQMLLEAGHQPHVVSRGYGGSLKGTVEVDPRKHTASQTGDEPLLLAAFCPVWITDSRAAGAEAAASAGASHILLDDGFQDPSLEKDLSIIVVDAKRGFGNGLCLPAGPLREPVSKGIARGDVLLSIGSEADQASFQSPQGISRYQAMLEPLQMGMDWEGTRVLAFAGIGHPEKFFASLRALGAEVIHAEALADHQPLARPLMQRLMNDAQRLNARLVTTEKDAVRLPQELRQEVLTLPVRLKLQEPEALQDMLNNL